MVPAKSLVVLAVILVSLVVSAPSAAAEWFADLYGGAAFTQSHHFSLDGKLDGVAVAGLIEDARYDPSFTVGRPARARSGGPPHSATAFCPRSGRRRAAAA